MAQLMDHVRYFAKEIGPRPAGTEEEQKASLYITEQFQKEAGFTANIEEFSTSSNLEAALAILALVTIVATVLALFFQVLAIPGFILAAAAAVVYALESYNRPLLSRVLSRGMSQNVVAKYQPNPDAQTSPSGRARTRKVVLIAHYDTGRTTPPLVDRLESGRWPLALIVVIAMVVAAFFALVRIFIGAAGGVALIFLNVLSIITLIVCAYPVAKALLMRSAPYNEGANNNATGTAALIEIARRISRGSVSEADLVDNANDVFIHGEQAAIEAGLVPEGAQIRYEAEQIAPPADLGIYDEEDRLLAAKAAIAALTGKPVERRVFGSVADKLVNSRAHEGDGAEAGASPASTLGEEAASSYDIQANSGAGAPVSTVAQSAGARTDSGIEFAPTTSSPSLASNAPGASDAVASGAGDAGGFSNAPSWFVSAQKNAKRPVQGESSGVQRSRYTEAIEHAERERAERERAAEESARERRESELRLREEEARAALLSRDRTSSSQQPEPPEQPAPHDGLEEPAAASATPEPDAPVASASEPPVASQPAAAAAEAASATPASTQAPEHTVPRRRSNMVPDLPPITADDAPQPDANAAENPNAPTADPARSGKLRKLRTSVPSLSGVIRTKESARKAAAVSVPAVVNVPSPSSPAAAPAHQPEQIDYDMEVPLDLAVGPDAGSGSGDAGDPDPRVNDAERGNHRRSWEGGAFSRMQLGHVNMRSGEDTGADEIIPIEPPEAERGCAITGEIEQIYHFRNPSFNTEVWFVAMGADNTSHEGARAFLAEHRDELRGSMLIEIESLGAGTLSVATEEGRLKKVVASSRIKRYTRNAVAATGIALNEVSLAGSDSIASTAQEAGCQAMHLFGAENGSPALKGSPDDVLENIDELLLDDHVNFIYELLKK